MWGVHFDVVDVGVDYFTTTATDKKTATVLLVNCEGLNISQERAGFYTKPWKLYGYSGYRCGCLEYGWRQDGAIARISSSLASSEWWRLYQITQRCSRIDLQVTLRCPYAVNAAIGRLAQEVEAFFESRLNGPKVTTISDNQGGMTVYVGRRASGLYFRAYNKGVESGLAEFEGTLRLELEVKSHLTRRVIDRLISGESVSAEICRTLHDYLCARGISSDLAEGLPRSFYERSTITSDELKSLLWLENAVQPTVTRLINRGLLQEVLENLGLPLSA